MGTFQAVIHDVFYLTSSDRTIATPTMANACPGGKDTIDTEWKLGDRFESTDVLATFLLF